jgi:F-type H+-transporting ATPase subunit epsilon
VTGGFAEITPQGTSVLAERAFPANAEGRAALDVILQEMRTKAANSSGADKDALDKAADDLERAIASIA